MSEKERKTLAYIAETLPKLPESAQQRFADMVTGAAMAVEMQGRSAESEPDRP